MRPIFQLGLSTLGLFTCAGFLANSLSAEETVPPAVVTPPAEAVQPKVETLTSEWKPMLDEKLSQWEIFMGVPHPTVTGLPEGTHQEKGNKGTPMGLNNDPKKVFSVRMVEGEPVLYITGEIYGCVSSLASYSNYHFRTQFRWLEKKWQPRLNSPLDSGILYHCTGPHGTFWNVWKTCIEYQVCENEFGKLYALAGTGAKVVDEFKNVFQKNQPPSLPDYKEKPTGEWNDLEYYVIGDRAVHLLNGVVVNVLRDMKLKGEKIGDKQTWTTLTAGQIQLQSEAAECEYRRVEIRGITEFPEAYRKYFAAEAAK
jgi:Domain of Unknown Function (DUF1080)